MDDFLKNHCPRPGHSDLRHLESFSNVIIFETDPTSYPNYDKILECYKCIRTDTVSSLDELVEKGFSSICRQVLEFAINDIDQRDEDSDSETQYEIEDQLSRAEAILGKLINDEEAP